MIISLFLVLFLDISPNSILDLDALLILGFGGIWDSVGLIILGFGSLVLFDMIHSVLDMQKSLHRIARDMSAVKRTIRRS